MPFRGSIVPLKFDKFHFMPYDEWQKYEWNNWIESCGRIDLPYCQKVALTDPIDRIQFNANYVGSNLLPTAADFTGTISSVSASQAVATGIGTASMVGYLISNTTTGDYATIINIVNANTVDLSDDIFPSTGHGVSVYAYFTSPNDIFHAEQSTAGTLITKESYAGTATLTVDAGLTSGFWYYMRVEVRNYESGQLSVKFGTTEAALLDTNGYQEFYGEASGSNVVFESSAAQNFVGSLRIASFEMYRLNTQDFGVLFSDDYSILAVGTPTSTPIVGALQAGVWMDDVSDAVWGEITGGECACFYIGIYSDPCYTENYIQPIKGECWTLGPNVQIGSGSIQFGNAEDGEKATYTCGMICPIECGEEYVLSFTVSNYTGGSVEIRFANGIYPITGNGDYQFSRTPSGLCTGLDVFEITATGPGVTTLDISDIRIAKVPVFEDANLISEKICACDELPCEIYVEYRHPVNAYGFPYEGEGLEDYRNRLRFCGEVTKSKMASNDYQVFKSSPGWYNTVYANLDNVEMLETEVMAPYMANALTVALSHNDVLIDGIPYVMKEFAQSSGQENTDLVQVNILVVKKDQTQTYTYGA